MAETRSALAIWSQIIKPAVFLVMALFFIAIVVGVVVPLTGEVFVDMGLWLAALIALNAFFARLAMKRAPRDPERVGDALFAQLASSARLPLARSCWGRLSARRLQTSWSSALASSRWPLVVWSAVRLLQFLVVC